MTALPSLKGQGEIYFMRHGQTAGDQTGVMKGLSEIPLSPEGERQAQAAGEWLAGRGITRILSSPLRRALQTAEIVAAASKINGVEITPELTELNVGVFSGLNQSEATAKFPEAYAAFRTRSWDGVPGADRSRSLFRRAGEFWKILSAHVSAGDSKILCVSHKGILQWILRRPFGGRRWMPIFEIDYCGIYRLSFDVSETNNFFIWDIMNLVAREKENHG